MSFPTPGGPPRTKHYNLEAIARTVGGHKIDQRQEAMAHAVYTDGSPAGIWGRIWRHGRYMQHKWTDDGVSQWAERHPEYNIVIRDNPQSCWNRYDSLMRASLLTKKEKAEMAELHALLVTAGIVVESTDF